MQTESFGQKDSCCAGLDFCWDPSAEAPFRSDRCALENVKRSHRG